MFYCGIDVAKRKHAVVIIDGDGQLVQRMFQVSNDCQGFAQLEDQLAGLDGPVHIGLESTGHYWLSLYDQLTRQSYPVTVLNPLQIHAYRRIDIRKRKTDKKDAQWVAEFLRFANPAPANPELPVFLQLRQLSRFRFRLSQQIGDCKRKVIGLLDRVFPEYDRLFSDVFLQTSRELLQQAVTAEEFAEFDLAELEQLLTKTSRGRYGADKAREIVTAAAQSVGVSFLADAVHTEMRCLLEQVMLLEKQRHQVVDQLTQLMTQLPQHILSIPGIGPATGAMLLGEIGDIERFEDASKLVAYAGIDPRVFASGQFEADRMAMSKRGSPYLRTALWQAATASLLHNPELRTYYDKKRGEGKVHGVALGAVCRKLLHRIYVVLKEQRPYRLE